MSTKQDLLTLLCPKFYKRLSAAGTTPLPGQIVSAHGVYPTDDAWIVKVHSYDGFNPGNSRYEIKRFEAGDRSHFPIAELQLRATKTSTSTREKNARLSS